MNTLFFFNNLGWRKFDLGIWVWEEEERKKKGRGKEEERKRKQNHTRCCNGWILWRCKHQVATWLSRRNIATWDSRRYTLNRNIIHFPTLPPCHQSTLISPLKCSDVAITSLPNFKIILNSLQLNVSEFIHIKFLFSVATCKTYRWFFY